MSKLKELVDIVDRLEVELEQAKHELRKELDVKVDGCPAPAPKKKYKKRKDYRRTKWFANKQKRAWAKKSNEEKARWRQAIKDGRRKWQAEHGQTIEK